MRNTEADGLLQQSASGASNKETTALVEQLAASGAGNKEATALVPQSS